MRRQVSPLALSMTLGCATVGPVPGETTRVPRNLKWCPEEVRQGRKSIPPAPIDAYCSPGDTFCADTSQKVGIPCVPLLSGEVSVGADRTVHGRFVFAFSTGADGAPTDLCLVTSDLGDTPDTLRCVAERFRSLPPKFKADLVNATWVMTWILEP